MLNLIVNARDAMPNGGEVHVATANASRSARVGRAILQRGDYVRVTVVDNGQGMPPAVARRALEPFYTTKGEAGTGLGLSQVYGFVRQVGGDMRIDSKPGIGTTVQLFFPRSAPVRPQPRADHETVAKEAPDRHSPPDDLQSGDAGGRVGDHLASSH